MEFPDYLHDALGEGRLQPDEFGIAAPEPGRIDADDVLQAAYGQVETLPVGGRAGGVRRLSPVDECQFLKGQQDPFNGWQR